jgi:crotonobetainyl-CoA:carnitine CoA-transferase CaiB-like acyl-CoA transferase
VELNDTGATVLANPIRWDGPNGSESTCGLADAPDLGADTDRILADIGLSAEAIDGLRQDGAIT